MNIYRCHRIKLEKLIVKPKPQHYQQEIHQQYLNVCDRYSFGNMKYLFITIYPRSSLTQSGDTLNCVQTNEEY